MAQTHTSYQTYQQSPSDTDADYYLCLVVFICAEKNSYETYTGYKYSNESGLYEDKGSFVSLYQTNS